MRREAHGGFGKRPEETDRPKDRHRASGRLHHLSVYLIQAYREYAPRVIITPQFLDEGTRYELTRDEAERLAQALLEAACILDGPQPAEHCVSEPS